MTIIVDLKKINKNFNVKPKQLEAISNVVNGFDTLAILPTSFGKSLIYQLLPAVASKLNICPSPVVVVISPLVSLIKDQIISCNNMVGLGIKAVEVSKSVSLNDFNIIFATPETWLNNKSILSTRHMLANLICIVVDEVHKVTW